MNTITVTLELTEENLMKLKTLINSKVAVVAAGETVSVSEPIPWDDPSTTITPPVKEETKEISFTKSDLRAVALKLSKANKKDVLAKVFKDNGGKKLSDFDDRPELYGKMIKEMEDALNG